jgi:predicted RNase H-like HicB family nuclease
MANRGSKDMRTYPPIISKDEAGIAIEFPNLPGCFTCGKSEEEAVARAKEALEGFLYVSERNGDPIPAPTSFEKIQVKREKPSCL